MVIIVKHFVAAFRPAGFKGLSNLRLFTAVKLKSTFHFETSDSYASGCQTVNYMDARNSTVDIRWDYTLHLDHNNV